MPRSTWVLDEKNNRLQLASEYYAEREAENRCRTGSVCIIEDAYAAGFESPIDGSIIDSRDKLREHNRRNGVVDIGGELRKPVYPQRDLEIDPKFVGAVYDGHVPIVDPKTLPTNVIPGDPTT